MSLLPRNAKKQERDLEAVVERFADLPVPLRDIWNPRKCPADLLPWLAWSFRVDFWHENLPDDVKRNLIMGAITWHRKKGTIWAVKKILDYLGFEATVKEWFELGTKAHTFSVTGYYKEDPNNLFFLGKDTEEILTEALIKAKPERSHLIFLTVAPPPVDMKDHICRWDWCTWDHGVSYEYDWPASEPIVGILAETAELGVTAGNSASGSYSRSDVWDGESWDGCRHVGMVDAVFVQVDMGLFFSWPDYLPSPKWSSRRTWRSGKSWRKSPEVAGSAEIGFKEVE